MLRRSLIAVFAVLVCSFAGFVQPARANTPPLVVIQAGHWKTEEHAEEFAQLRTSTGATAGGVREVDLNVDIAHRAAEYLKAWGNEVYVLPSSIPPAYKADAFVALHSDGNSNTSARGFKLATYWRNWVASDVLMRELKDEYAKQTGLPEDWRITENMRGYYAFNSGLYQTTIAEDTPGAILEMGFLSNPTDRAFMTENRDLIARAIALGIARFLGARPAEGWPAPPLLPRGDIVQVLNPAVPLFDGPGEQFNVVHRAGPRQRFAVVERQNGWARLFSYTGEVRWIREEQTAQVYVP